MSHLFLTVGNFSRFATSKRSIGMGEALAKLGEAVVIVALDCSENRERLAAEAPHCTHAFFKTSGAVVEALQKLKLIWRYRPKFVYCSSYCLRTLAGFRWFFPFRTQYVLEFCELYSVYGERSLRWKLFERLAINAADRIVCASRYLERVVASRTHKPVLYLPYAFTSGWPHDFVSDGRPHVLFMASLWRGYGIYDVIEAVLMVHEKRPDVVLDVLGSGPEKDAVIEMIRQKGLGDTIRVHGFVAESDLPRFFAQASVFVAPLHDTVQDVARCPSKVYYYIPYAKPIVTCALGDPLETLGDCGYYYKPDDIGDLARQIAKAIAEADHFCYPEGFVEKHSWDARARTYKEWLT